MSEYGEYLVVGRRAYRGHDPGTRFLARLDPKAAARAIARGDIRLERTIVPRPGPYTLPPGWLETAAHQTTEAPQGASLIERG